MHTYRRRRGVRGLHTYTFIFALPDPTGAQQAHRDEEVGRSVDWPPHDARFKSGHSTLPKIS